MKDERLSINTPGLQEAAEIMNKEISQVAQTHPDVDGKKVTSQWVADEMEAGGRFNRVHRDEDFAAERAKDIEFYSMKYEFNPGEAAWFVDQRNDENPDVAMMVARKLAMGPSRKYLETTGNRY